MKLTSSRAIAAQMTVVFFPRAPSARYRAVRQFCRNARDAVPLLSLSHCQTGEGVRSGFPPPISTTRRPPADKKAPDRPRVSVRTLIPLARGSKTLKGLTPYEFICKLWTKEPERFMLDPLHQMPGLNI